MARSRYVWASPGEYLCGTHLLSFLAEYLEGGTLEAVLDIAVALSERRTRLIIAELACAVGHIHGLGILHRDIKVDRGRLLKHDVDSRSFNPLNPCSRPISCCILMATFV